MYHLDFYDVLVALPLLSLGCLGAGLWRRGRCSARIFAVALLSPVTFFVLLTIGGAWTDDLFEFGTLMCIWMTASVAMLIWAMLWSLRDSRGRRLLGLVSLAIPAPFMAGAALLGVTFSLPVH